MTREEAMEQLKFMVEQKPKEPPAECDYIEEWYDTDKDIRNALDMAIKALEQEPSEDCVSRQAVLEKINDWWGITSTSGEPTLCDCIRELPPLTPTQRWISVSERLPEENGFYLATCDGEICGENEPFTGLAEYENGKWVDDEEDYQCVLAWMPLPEPYKAERKSE